MLLSDRSREPIKGSYKTKLREDISWSINVSATPTAKTSQNKGVKGSLNKYFS